MLGTIMPTSSIKFQLSKIRKARELLEKKEKELLSKTHETTIAKIVQIASDNGITAAEIVAAIKFKKTKKTSFLRASPKKVPEKRGKVAAKYRNPADASIAWSGRGKMPLWVKQLHEAGTLETALILPKQ